MGFLDGLSDPMFKRDANGRILFYPSGKLGKARILPDEATAGRLRKTVKYGMLTLIAVVVALVLVTPIWIAIPGAMVVGGLWQLYLVSAVRDCPKSDETLTFKEIREAQARALGLGWLIPFAILSVLLMAVSAYLALAARGNPLVGWIGVLIFGACLVSIVLQIRTRLRQTR